MRIVRDMGIFDILKMHLTEQEATHVLALAISKVVRPLPQASISAWYDGAHLSVLMPASLASQGNSDLMEKIGLSDLYRKFSHDLVERLHPGDSLLYDITSIPSYSPLDIFEYGHAKYRPELEQVKPMIPGIEIILDRGFFSPDNLKILSGMRYVIAASMVRKEIRFGVPQPLQAEGRHGEGIQVPQDGPGHIPAEEPQGIHDTRYPLRILHIADHTFRAAEGNGIVRTTEGILP